MRATSGSSCSSAEPDHTLHTFLVEHGLDDALWTKAGNEAYQRFSRTAVMSIAGTSFHAENHRSVHAGMGFEEPDEKQRLAPLLIAGAQPWSPV
jgi:hypothetical protein